MRFSATPLADLMVIDAERISDERGFFARTWCADELAAHGVDTTVAQCSVSNNTHKGTLRGIHFQVTPFEEAKLVRCERGALFDVAVDLRTDSDTYGQWFGTDLSADNLRMLFIPKGFGHAFQTLADDTQVVYQISQRYVPDSGAGIRYDDATIGINWPLPVSVISAKDRAWPALNIPAVEGSN